MNILHVLTDWKWTGPSAPTVELLSELHRRGARVVLACVPSPPGTIGGLAECAAREGLPVASILASRGRVRPFRYRADARTIRDMVRAERFHVVHTHGTHEHVLAAYAMRHERRAKIVRTNHTGLPIRGRLGEGTLFRKWTDGYLTFTRGGLEQDLRAYPDLGRCAASILPGMRLDRYGSVNGAAKGRQRLGVSRDEILFGTVARVQARRKVDVLLKGFQLALMRRKDLRLAIVGRGTKIEELAHEPARALGVYEYVVFTGYLQDDYLSTLSALDAFVMLRPGSDGTARAMREAMLMGRPIVAARWGMLPELLNDGTAGRVIETDADAVKQAFLDLAADPGLRDRMGRAARERARDFDIGKTVDATMELYERALRS